MSTRVNLQIHDPSHETMITSHKANKRNYEVKFSINTILNNEIDKKKLIKK